MRFDASLPKTSIVILSYDNTTNVLECVRSIQEMDYNNYNVIIVDNSSKNRISDEVKHLFLNVHIIENDRNRGFAEGNNIGIRYALSKGADYIFLLNDDTTVNPDVISALVKIGEEHHDVGMLCPRIVSYVDRTRQYVGGRIEWASGVGIEIESFSRALSAMLDTDYAPGCALLVKADVVRQIGLLDPDFFAYFEDVDWSMRCWKAGYRVVVAPEVAIYHKGSMDQSSSKSPFATFLFRRNQVLFMRKYAHWYQWPSFLKHYSRQCLMRIHDVILAGESDKADAILDGCWAGMTGEYGATHAVAPEWFKSFIRRHLNLWLWLTSWLFFFDYQKVKRERARAARVQA